MSRTRKQKVAAELRRTRPDVVCSILNLLALGISSTSIVALVVILSKSAWPVWAYGVVSVPILIGSGYLVQYWLSGLVNSWVYGRDVDLSVSNSGRAERGGGKKDPNR